MGFESRYLAWLPSPYVDPKSDSPGLLICKGGFIFYRISPLLLWLVRLIDGRLEFSFTSNFVPDEMKSRRFHNFDDPFGRSNSLVWRW